MKQNKGLTRAQQKRIKKPVCGLGYCSAYFQESYVNGRWDLILHGCYYNRKDIKKLIKFLNKADKYLKEVNCENK
jgi:hypothetical protein